MVPERVESRPLPLAVVTGVVRLDLTTGTHATHRARAAHLEHAPLGAAVRVIVGPRHPAAAGDVFAFLVDAATARGLRLQVEGDDADAVNAWLYELRDSIAQRLLAGAQ